MILKNRRTHHASPRGYSLLVTLMLLAMLAAAIGVLVQTLIAAGRTSGEMVQRRENFYTCDGLSRTVTKLSQDYLVQAETPNDVDLKAAICTASGGCTLPTITPSGYAVSTFDVTIGDITTGPIPSGPFRDMNARQTTVAMDLRAVRSGSGFACETHQDITLAQVGLFQFFVFAEDFLDFYPGANMTAEGRIHVNGDVCIGSSATLNVETITAVGDIFAGADLPRCRAAFPAAGLQVRDKVSNAYRQMNAAMDHSCTACGATPWVDYALTRWGGNVLDSAHKVPFLRVPVTGDPPVQDGQNAAAGVANNAETQRFIVDPPTAGELSGVGEQRMAIKADIRIINGVWYKRDPDNPTLWPGTPIWSDHPGKFTTTNHVGVERVADVGQQDITDDLGYGAIPNRYSYYEYDPGTNVLVENNEGVISYGSLFRDGTVTPPVWRPGFFLHHDANTPVGPADPAGLAAKHRFCAFKNTTQSWDEDDFGAAAKNSPTAGEYAVVDATVAGKCFACLGDNIANIDGDCTDGAAETLVDVGIGGQVLEAARTGFHDQRAAASGAPGSILPVNFDVAQLRAALADTSAGELGSHFSGGADFNGIIYISYTWDNQMDGIGAAGGGALPGLWPDPRLAADPAQPMHHTNHAADATHFADAWGTTALPWPLCSGEGPFATTGGVGRDATQRYGFSAPADNGGTTPTWFEPVFTVPNCATAGTTTRPNAIRVINAYTVDPAMFPKGLTIATNIPAYILGSANGHSDDVIINGVGADDADWRPMLVAADAVTLLSNAWTDARAPWTRASVLAHRVPTASKWRVALLTGNVRTTGSGGSVGNYSGGLENFPRFLEGWGGVTTTIRGSLVLGFNSVYQRQNWGQGNVYGAPVRDWGYDTKLNAISNQPPGAPVYNVQAIKRWSAE